MSSNELLQRQIEPFFKMLDQILNAFSDEDLVDQINGIQIGKLIYHPMYWIHLHINFDNSFRPAKFHTENLHTFEVISNKLPSISDLKDYSEEIKQDITHQISISNPDSIYKGTITIQDKILGQIRHSSYHIGILHFLIFQRIGKWPEYLGPDFPKTK